jgi:hypothetical protein
MSNVVPFGQMCMWVSFSLINGVSADKSALEPSDLLVLSNLNVPSYVVPQPGRGAIFFIHQISPNHILIVIGPTLLSLLLPVLTLPLLPCLPAYTEHRHWFERYPG